MANKSFLDDLKKIHTHLHGKGEMETMIGRNLRWLLGMVQLKFHKHAKLAIVAILVSKASLRESKKYRNMKCYQIPYFDMVMLHCF